MTSITVNQLELGKGKPKICLSFFGGDMAQVRASYEENKDLVADILEWRLDYLVGGAYEDVDSINALLAQFRDEGEKRPIILTLRTEEEGGRASLPSRTYRDIVRTLATESTADILDIEAFAKEDQDPDVTGFLVSLAKENGKTVILSNHDFTSMPKERAILERLMTMEKLGADIPKVAYMAKTDEEARTLLSAAADAGEILDVPFIAMAMGEAGKQTRIAAGMFGSCITYGYGKTGPAAPGQIEVTELKQHLEAFYR